MQQGEPEWTKGLFDGEENWTTGDGSETIFEVLPSWGGRPRRLVLGGLDLWRGHATVDEAREDAHAVGARLCPWPNRLIEGTWIFEGRAHQVPVDAVWEAPVAVHGFVRRARFVVEKADCLPDGTARLCMTWDHDGSHPGFPFPFRAVTTYELHWHDGLTVRSGLVNTGASAMPYGDGWHPYLPTPDGADRWTLQLPVLRRAIVDSRSIPHGEVESFGDFQTARVVGDQALNDVFLLQQQSEIAEVRLVSPRGESAIVWQDALDYPWLQLYIPPDRQSMAIEPLTCPAGMLATGIGRRVLEPGQSVSLRWGIRRG